jgi:hypothetical protein
LRRARRVPHEISVSVSMPNEWQAAAVLAGVTANATAVTANPTVPGFSSNPILGEVERAAIREIVHRLPDALRELWTWLHGLEFTGIHDWFVALWVGFVAVMVEIASWFLDLFRHD